MTETTGQVLTAVEKIEKVREILKENEYKPSRLIPILQAVQEVYRYLPKEVMNFVAEELKIPAGKIYGVATFYAHFSLDPKGKHLIRICDGTACHVRGSEPILTAVRNKLGLTKTKSTTDDMLFTLETVSCLGACGLAPVMVVDEDVHGQMTPDKAVALIDEILKTEKA
ncbi:MAG: NADH-quinone oxidoreductase subunit NuoE [Alphaproteobacteria bacterium]|nr:NADH-quinone oxidoreductase subunit NuoE [Alphaproteobacteria bacterium]